MDLKACQEVLEKDFKQRLQVIHKKENGYNRQFELHTLLHSAIEFGMTDFLEKQIDDGIVRKYDINFRKPNGLALIHTAVSSNQLEIVQILIKHGAILEFPKETPLHLATYFGYNDIAKLLLKNGADPDVAVDGETPLHFAVSNNDFETVELLLKKSRSNNVWGRGIPFKKNVDPKDQNGFTPLHRAINSNRKDIVELLISKGANIGMLTLTGGTRPLHIATFNGFIEIAEILIRNGAELDNHDIRAFTPLHLAILPQSNFLHKLNFTKKETKFERNLQAIYGTPISNQYPKSQSDKPDVTSNQLEMVKLLIKHGANLDYDATKCGKNIFTNSVKLQESPLHLATFFGYNTIAQLLLENGANPDVAVDGVTPLHFAASNNDFETIDLLLKKTRHVDPKDQYRFTPLHRAIQSNRKDIVELLIAKGANIGMATLSGTNPLHIAAFNGFIEIAEILIKNGAKLDVEDSEGFTPLHLALSHQNIPNKINFADIETKFEQNLKNTYGTPKQGDESQFDIPEMVRISLARMLIEHGANINAQDNEKLTPLHYALNFNDLDFIKYLINQKASVNVSSFNRTYPIHTASKNGHAEMVKLLIDHGAYPRGAHVNVIDSEGYTPLDFAVIHGHFDVVNTLLEHGANVNQQDFKQNQPIHHAAHQGNLEIAKLLLQNGANVSAKDSYKNTPLMLAVEKNQVEMSKMLIENGANINEMNKIHERPISIAVQNGHLEVTKLLIQNGAELNFNVFCPLPIAVSNGINIFIIKQHILLCVQFGLEFHDQFSQHWEYLDRKDIPEDIVELLIRNEANVDIKKKSDKLTLFHIAMTVNPKLLPKLFPYSKMDINARLFNDETLLHFAIRLGFYESIPILIQNGASLNTKNGENMSPLEMALKKKTPNVMKRILNLCK